MKHFQITAQGTYGKNTEPSPPSTFEVSASRIDIAAHRAAASLAGERETGRCTKLVLSIREIA